MIVIRWHVLSEQNSGLVQETNVFHLILPLLVSLHLLLGAT